jgi:hypothetical protein
VYALYLMHSSRLERVVEDAINLKNGCYNTAAIDTNKTYWGDCMYGISSKIYLKSVIAVVRITSRNFEKDRRDSTF